MKSKADVMTMVRGKIRLLHFAYSTEQSYCGWVARYYDFCRGLPAGLPPEHKTEAFLTHLAQDQRVAAKTQNQAFAALLFLYEHVLEQPLRRQIEHARRVWESDRANFKDIGVTLPGRLAVKYPLAPFSWQWFWVFPAAEHCRHPRTGEWVRFHILPDAVQRAVHAAARQLGLDGLVTPHVLRHAYATHSRESIDALRVLMGHVSIETTAGYKHPVVETASNPLDDLAG